MALKKTLFIIILVNSISVPNDAAFPGTFFWKPRLGIDLSISATEPGVRVMPPTKDNVLDGYVVLINGYSIGITMVGLMAALDDRVPLEHLDPTRAWFYTNAYRWAYRHISMMPTWLGGHGAQYIDTHRAWRRRFFYQDKFVPEWMRYLFPWVPKDDWKEEERQFKKFQRYAEPAFGKHYIYPARFFNNFQSQLTNETIENLDRSSNSIPRYG